MLLLYIKIFKKFKIVQIKKMSGYMSMRKNRLSQKV